MRRWVPFALGALALGGCCVATAVVAALAFFHGERIPAPAPGPKAKVQHPDAMASFFEANKRTEPALTHEQVTKLAGAWEARYVSFELDRVPADASAIPAATLTLEPTAQGARVQVGKGAARALVLAGARLRAAGSGDAPELVLRVEGAELVGELRTSHVHAELRARRR